MRMVFLFSIISLLLSCGGPKSEGEEKQTNTTSKTRISKDSLRKLYVQYADKIPKPLPEQKKMEKGKLYPVDEAPKDTAFFVFREQLREVIKNKDVFGLLDAVNKDIKCSLDGNNGLSGFVGMWHLDATQVDTLQIWHVLASVLSKGGAFSQGGKYFSAPYVNALWPDDYDAIDYGVVTGSGVRMRSAPSTNSSIVKTVSYNIVMILDVGVEEEINGEQHPWVQIELLDGRQGYIYGKFVGSPTDYRAGFAYDQYEGWNMDVFLAGE